MWVDDAGVVGFDNKSAAMRHPSPRACSACLARNTCLDELLAENSVSVALHAGTAVEHVR